MGRIRQLYIVPLILLSSFLWASADWMQAQDVQQFIRSMVRDHGFQRSQVVAVLKQAKFQPKIIDLMNHPYEKQPWDVYKALFLNQERIQKGLIYWHMNQSALEKAEKQFGVPAQIIVAVIGVETLYGERNGTWRVLDALTTLAFHYPKRAKFFTSELKAYFLLCRELGVSPTEYLGSYAGAMGSPQFMPSSYRVYAVDFTGNGKRDLMNDPQDVIGSVANYLKKHGWNKNQGIAQPANIQDNILKRFKTNQKNADYSIKKLLSAGLIPVSAGKPAAQKAGLIELFLRHGREYWVAYPNFYVITRYNVSPQYALAVYLLSEELQQGLNNQLSLT